MKKSLKRILIIAVAVLLIGAAVAVGIIASNSVKQNAGNVSLDIVATNLSFRDSVCIKYAVNCVGVNAADVSVLVWSEPQADYVKGSESAVISAAGTETINGNVYPVFDYKELAAKQMTDVVYARAYVKVGDTEYYSKPQKYSILQYAYKMLGKTGSPTNDTKLIALLEDMLNYGALAQKYTNYKTDMLATDEFVQIKLVGGKLEDGFNHGLYKVGTTVKVTAPAAVEDFDFVGWRNLAGEIVSKETVMTVTAGKSNERYTAVYQGKTSDKLEYTYNEDGITYSVIGIGQCTDSNIVIPSVVGDTLVTGIADGAFKNCANIKSITISNNIVSIGADAFSGCTSLTSIYYKGIKTSWYAVVKGENWNGGNNNIEVFWEKSPEDWELGGVPLT